MQVEATVNRVKTDGAWSSLHNAADVYSTPCNRTEGVPAAVTRCELQVAAGASAELWPAGATFSAVQTFRHSLER
jgi:hypothetical protein